MPNIKSRIQGTTGIVVPKHNGKSTRKYDLQLKKPYHTDCNNRPLGTGAALPSGVYMRHKAQTIWSTKRNMIRNNGEIVIVMKYSSGISICVIYVRVGKTRACPVYKTAAVSSPYPNATDKLYGRKTNCNKLIRNVSFTEPDIKAQVIVIKRTTQNNNCFVL